MKTLVVKASGEPRAGDFVILSYRAPRGGRSDAKYRVNPPQVTNIEEIEACLALGQTPPEPNRIEPSIADVMSGLAMSINSEKSEWCPGSGDFKASVRGETLYVQCSDMVTNVEFSVEVTGSGSLQFELREMGRSQ